ncbi:MAG: hypothetical protein LBM70_04060 [Victivallales bacterium]|nr:hypothetical protein [Victivallales bacterium]
MKLTLAELRSAADKYFHRHLAREEWSVLSEEIKQSSLVESEADVALYLNMVDVDSEEKLALNALFEQAIHLARKNRRHPAEKRLISEEISGIGQRSWEYPEEKESPDYSPRAIRMMDSLLHGNIRIGRG